MTFELDDSFILIAFGVCMVIADNFRGFLFKIHNCRSFDCRIMTIGPPSVPGAYWSGTKVHVC